MQRSLLIASCFSLIFLACGSDSKSGADGNPDTPDGPSETPDAFTGPDNLKCIGSEIPKMAEPMVTISGTTLRVSAQGAAQVAAPVKLYDDSGTLVAEQTSDAMGAFAITVSTSGTPLNGYLRAVDSDPSVPNAWDTFIVPPHDVYKDLPNAAVMLGSGQIWGLMSLLVTGSGLTSGNGLVAIAVTDCEGKVLEGVSISTQAASTVYYPDLSNVQNPGAWPNSTGSDGLALIFDVPAGALGITAETSDGYTLRANTIDVRPDALTSTLVVP